MRPELEALAREPQRSAVLLDFDGSLSEIVEHPDLARPVEGAMEAVSALIGRYGLVALVTGRTTEDATRLLPVRDLIYVGRYGLDATTAASFVDVSRDVLEEAREIAATVPGAWVEDKGLTLAVHHRQALDPESAHDELKKALARVAAPARLEVIEGKMVLELVPAGWPRKGGAIDRLLRDRSFNAAMFAGDDLADLEAFAVLAAFREQGMATTRVAVRSAETPQELLDAADLVVPGPPGLVNLLHDLAAVVP